MPRNVRFPAYCGSRRENTLDHMTRGELDPQHTALVPAHQRHLQEENTLKHVARGELDPQHQLLYLQPVDTYSTLDH